MGNLSESELKKIRMGKSFKAKFETMNMLHVDRNNLSQVLKVSEATGVKDLDTTAKAILLRCQNGDFEEAFELASWSANSSPESRKVVVNSFLKNKQAPLLVHQIARMKRSEATDLMKDYFTEGGNIKDIAEWLSVAGSILKTGLIPDDSDGPWGWLKRAVGSVVDTVSSAINTVGDAISKAGKNLLEAVSSVAGWAQNQISDFVEAVLKTGKTVVQLLNEVAKLGLSAIQKFVHAIFDAGKSALEVINWAINQAESVLKTVLEKLEQLMGSFTSLLIEIAKVAANRLFVIVNALISAGKSVLNFVIRLDRIAYTMATRIVLEIRRVGRTVKELMIAVINTSRIIARTVIDGLRAFGDSIFSMLQEVANQTFSVLSVFIGALKDLGIALRNVLDEVAKFVGIQIKKLMQALRIIWTQIREVLEAIAEKSIFVINTLLTALLGTFIYLKEVLSTIILEVRAAFREGLIKGLIAIGKSALTLLKETAKISASAVAILFGIILDLSGSHRGLKASERAEAEKIFGISINLDFVRLTDANLATDLVMWMNKNRPFTTMYCINYKSGTTLQMDVLIHELAHIWQAVTSGGVYMIEALHSQFFGKGYNLSEVDIRKANGKLLNLEREQQAVLVQEYWKGHFDGQKILLPLDLLRPLALQVHKSSFVLRPISIRDFDFGGRQILINRN